MHPDQRAGWTATAGMALALGEALAILFAMRHAAREIERDHGAERGGAGLIQPEQAHERCPARFRSRNAVRFSVPGATISCPMRRSASAVMALRLCSTLSRAASSAAGSPASSISIGAP